MKTAYAAVLHLLILFSLELKSSLSAGQNYLGIFQRAANVGPSELLSIPDVDQVLQFTCSSPCGLLSWEINHKSIIPIGSYQGPATDLSHVVERCSGGSCREQQYLPCDEAADGVNLVSRLRIRPQADLVVQCVSSITIDNMIYVEYSRALWVMINDTVSTGKNLTQTICPTSTPSSSHHQSSTPTPTPMASRSPTSGASTTTRVSKQVSATSSVRSHQLPSVAPSSDTIEMAMMLCFVNKPEFTYALVGTSGALLVLALVGWVLFVYMCCKNKKDKNSAYERDFMQRWDCQSSQQSTLERCVPQPHGCKFTPADSTGENLDGDHVIYEHSPQPARVNFPLGSTVV